MAKNPQAKSDATEKVNTLDQLLEQYGGGGYMCRLYRLDAKTMRPVFISTIPAEEVTPEEVQRTFGGGTFQFRIYDGSTYKKAVTVDIAGPYRDLSKDSDAETPAERGSRMDDEQGELERRLRELRLEDRMEAFQREVRGFLAEVRNPPPQANDASSIMMAMELVKAMQTQLAPHVTTPPVEVPALLDILKIGMEMGARNAPPEARDGYSQVLDRLAPPLVRLLERVTGEGEPAPTQNPPQAPEGPEQVQTLRAALGRYVPHIVQWAREGADPFVRALLVLEQIEGYWRTQVAEFLRREGQGAITTLLGWYPQLGAYRPWVSSFLEELRGELDADDAPDDDDDGPEVELGGPGGVEDEDESD